MNPQRNLPLAIIVGQGYYAERCQEVFRARLSDQCRTYLFPSPLAAEAAFYDSDVDEDLMDAPVALLMAVVGDDTDPGDDILLPMLGLQIFRNAQVMLLTTSLEVSGLEGVIEAGHLDWIGYAPDIELDAFIGSVKSQINRFNYLSGFSALDRVYSIFDQPYTDNELIKRILERIESSLGAQPRIHIPRDTTLTVPGRWVEEVTIVLEGSVALMHEASHGGIVMHEQSTGRVIGLLALSEGRRALLAAVTTSDVVAIRLTIEQLNTATEGHPDIVLLLATLFIRSLDRRLRRSEALHIQNAELSEQIEKERRSLATALENLEQARTELMAQQRMASLGALASGMAHELNNPTAAISRTTEHLIEGIGRLVTSSPGRRWSEQVQTAMQAGLESHSLSTKAERALRSQFAEITGDPSVAHRLVLAGIRDPEVASGLGKRFSLDVEQVENAASIGVQLRNLRSASKRIANLVDSLRSYARPDGDPVTQVDIHDNLDDAIRLLSHKLEGIEVVREYEDIDPIEAHPGELAQVWTNVLTNAAEAIVDATDSDQQPLGTITVKTSEPRPGLLRVEITDSGPGISEGVLDRIFEPRFTTKSGQVRFGLGIGLGVARTIVDKHNGTIRIDTSSEGTTVVVDLPMAWEEEA